MKCSGGWVNEILYLQMKQHVNATHEESAFPSSWVLPAAVKYRSESEPYAPKKQLILHTDTNKTEICKSFVATAIYCLPWLKKLYIKY